MHRGNVEPNMKKQVDNSDSQLRPEWAQLVMLLKF